MGRHADEKRGRGLAGWVIAAAVAVIVVIVAVAGYIVVMARSSADGLCTSTTSLSIAAGPSASTAIADVAAAYNKTAPVARSSCVTARVNKVTDHDALTGLTDDWSSEAGPAPGLWIPDSTASLAALDAISAKSAAGHVTQAFAWSPLVLAMNASDAAAASSLSWSDLATAAAAGHAVTLSTDRALILAMPPVAAAPSTSYAVQSLLADEDATSSISPDTVDAHSEIIAAVAAAYSGAASSTDEALATLARPRGGDAPESDSPHGDTPDSGAATAVPVIEANLVMFDRHTAGDPLTAVYLAGATVSDALIAAPIHARWTDPTVNAAASDFQAFLADPIAQQILADHGWRTRSATPTEPIREVSTTTDVTLIPAAGPAVDRAIAVALGQQEAPDTSTPPEPTTSSKASTTPTTAPSSTPTTTAPPTTSPTAPPPTTSPTTPDISEAAKKGPVLTLIVDTSADMATKVNGKSLLEWVTLAVARLDDGSVTNQIGLWAYSDALVYPPSGFPRLVPTGPLSGTVTQHVTKNGEEVTVVKPRPEALADATAALTADGERWAYGALMEALQSIPNAAIDGRQSRVILFTSGVDETPGTPRRLVIDAVQQVADSVRVDVVGLGDAVPVDAYSDIASASDGGEYIPAPQLDLLGQQLVDLLTLGD